MYAHLFNQITLILKHWILKATDEQNVHEIIIVKILGYTYHKQQTKITYSILI